MATSKADLKAEMQRLIPVMRNIDTPAGAKARLLFHRLGVLRGLQRDVPRWVLENAREKGVKV